jgi:hypothetical protein
MPADVIALIRAMSHANPLWVRLTRARVSTQTRVHHASYTYALTE